MDTTTPSEVEVETLAPEILSELRLALLISIFDFVRNRRFDLKLFSFITAVRISPTVIVQFII